MFHFCWEYSVKHKQIISYFCHGCFGLMTFWSKSSLQQCFAGRLTLQCITTAKVQICILHPKGVKCERYHPRTSCLRLVKICHSLSQISRKFEIKHQCLNEVYWVQFFKWHRRFWAKGGNWWRMIKFLANCTTRIYKQKVANTRQWRKRFSSGCRPWLENVCALYYAVQGDSSFWYHSARPFKW